MNWVISILHIKNVELFYPGKPGIPSKPSKYWPYISFKDIKQFPAIVILEPKLLQMAHNSKNLQYQYENNLYVDEFVIRAQKVVNVLTASFTKINSLLLTF